MARPFWRTNCRRFRQQLPLWTRLKADSVLWAE